MRGTRLAFVAAMVVALVAAGCAGPTKDEGPTFEQARALAAEQGKLLLADFYTDW